MRRPHLLLAVPVALLLAAAPARAAQTTVAVCTFKALKSDAATDWIGGGIQQSVVADLSKALSVGVRDLSSKDVTDPDQAAAVARKDNIDVVVVGSFQVVGDEIRATGKVLQSSGRQVAFLSAKASLKEVFRLQDSIAKQVHDAVVHEPVADPNAPATMPADGSGVRPIPFPGSLLQRALADEASGRRPADGRTASGTPSRESPTGWNGGGPINGGSWGGGGSGIGVWGGGYGWGNGWVPYYPYPSQPGTGGTGGGSGGSSGGTGSGTTTPPTPPPNPIKGNYNPFAPGSPGSPPK